MSHRSALPKAKRLLLFALAAIVMAQGLVSAQTKTSPQPDDALLFREGELLFGKGEVEKALWRFKRLTSDHPRSPLFNEAQFRMGICYTQLKRPKDGIRVLNDLLATFLAPSRMVQVLSLMGDNYLELKDPFNALYWFGKGLLVPGQPGDDLKIKIKAALDTLETEEALAKVETLYRGAYAGGYAALRMARIVKRRGDLPLLKKMVADLEREYSGMDYLPSARELLGSTQVSSKSKHTVGVILPLSGTHQTFGTKVLQSIQLAFQDTRTSGNSLQFPLSIRDSKGSPRETERAVDELVTKEKVVVILGPLLSGSVEPAARRAQQLKVPLFTLSQKDPITGTGGFVFQNALTPGDQVRVLVSFAVKQMSFRTFAVFYPNSPYGLHYKNLFNREVSREGGRVLGSIAYQEEQTDLSEEIKGFFKIKPVQEYDSRKRKAEEFKAALTVDAVFIPDTYDRVGLILSQMAYFDITGTAFLGTNAWNDTRLISTAGPAAEKSFFVDCFFKGNPAPESRRFVEDFRKLYQREPDSLEAITYDGARFVREILQAQPLVSPHAVRNAVSRFETFQGITGLKGFGENGKATRNLSVLTIRNNQIVPASPSP